MSPATATLTAPPVSQTRSFITVFLIEMWERFGFYGMQALMVTYLIKKLGFADTDSNLIWGAAAALIYATPAIGGWVGDRLLGTRRTLVIGAMVLALGYAMLWIPSDKATLTYMALGVIVVGNGLFKPNAGNLVRKIYEGDETRIDSAFTIYYMAVNLGSMISMWATPKIRDVVGASYGSSAGWHTAFGVCAIGLIAGLINLAFLRKTLAHIGSAPDHAPVDRKRLFSVLGAGIVLVFVCTAILQSKLIAEICVFCAGFLILGIFGYMIAVSEKKERAGMTAALVLTIQTIFFFIFYAQMATSLNLFAQHNVNLSQDFFGTHLFTWIPEQYQVLNAFWIVVLSPVLVLIYNSLGRVGKDPPVAAKFAMGFIAVAAGFFIYGVGARWQVGGQVSSWIMIWGYGLYSLGELLVSGLGLAMIARYAPARMGGFMMGAYFVAVGVSQYLGSMVANIAHIPDNISDPVQSLTIYTKLFNELGFVGLICVAIALLILPLMNRLSASHSNEATHQNPLTASHSEEGYNNPIIDSDASPASRGA